METLMNSYAGILYFAAVCLCTLLAIGGPDDPTSFA